MWARPGVSLPLLAALVAALLAGPQQADALPAQLPAAAITDIMASYGNASNALSTTNTALNTSLNGRALNFAVRYGKGHGLAARRCLPSWGGTHASAVGPLSSPGWVSPLSWGACRVPGVVPTRGVARDWDGGAVKVGVGQGPRKLPFCRQGEGPLSRPPPTPRLTPPGHADPASCLAKQLLRPHRRPAAAGVVRSHLDGCVHGGGARPGAECCCCNRLLALPRPPPRSRLHTCLNRLKCCCVFTLAAGGRPRVCDANSGQPGCVPGPRARGRTPAVQRRGGGRGALPAGCVTHHLRTTHAPASVCVCVCGPAPSAF